MQITPLEAYENSLKKGIKVSFWKNGQKVEENIFKDIGDARLRAYALNWEYKIEGKN